MRTLPSTLNFQYHASLGGQVLRSNSVDKGISHVLYDIEGRPMWQQDARGTVQQYQYDQLGRVTRRTEAPDGLGDDYIRERWVYGEDESMGIDEAKSKNLRGQMVRHYDTAGLVDQSGQGYALSGGAVQQVRQLLPVDEESDWQGEEATWQARLEDPAYTTHWTYDAQGRVLQQTDAKGHVQDMGYDVQGRLKHSGVTPAGGTRQAVLLSQSYSAAGQKLHEEAGNGVVTEYAYEPETQRLLNTQTIRILGSTILQDLSYGYDPVGNIVAIHNAAEATQYFRNQTINADRAYTYDSLYQLVSATGRENAAASPAPVDIDNPSAVVPIDTHNYTNYTRNYRYDAGGNLHQIQHQGLQISYNRTMTIAATNNRIAEIQRSNTAPAFTMPYDACGNQKQLDTGQSLVWNGLNQLQQVTTIERTGGEDDEEVYQYAGDGMRIRKLQSTQASGTTHTQEVIYLPGLELRRKHNGATTTEDLEMLTIGAAGRSQVRLLNWVMGKPDNIDNEQLRYSLDDHLGSSQLELDQDANVLTREEYFPYGGTAVRSAKSDTEVKYKVIRYSGKERDASGLYYYGFRYYQPWLGRWLNPDPAGTVDGLNLYQMVRNNPVVFLDTDGLVPWSYFAFWKKQPQSSAPYAPVPQNWLGSVPKPGSKVKSFVDIHITNRVTGYDFDPDIKKQANHQQNKTGNPGDKSGPPKNYHAFKAIVEDISNKAPDQKKRLYADRHNQKFRPLDNISNNKTIPWDSGTTATGSIANFGQSSEKHKIRINVHGDGKGNIGMGRNWNQKSYWMKTPAKNIVDYLVHQGYLQTNKDYKNCMTLTLALCGAARHDGLELKDHPSGVLSTIPPRVSENSALGAVTRRLVDLNITGITVTGSDRVVAYSPKYGGKLKPSEDTFDFQGELILGSRNWGRDTSTNKYRLYSK